MFEILPNVSFWTIINFILLLIILRIFAWKPILSVIEKREKKIQDSIDRADEAQKEAEKKLQEHKELLEKLKRESVDIISLAKERAQKLQDEILKKAETDAKLMIGKAKNEITLEKEKALEEIKAKVADISVALASKMISKSINPDDHRELINNAIKELE
jgi:F-type H+-transporting ATPase subunit b